MKLFQPDLELAFEDLQTEELAFESIDELKAFDFDSHIRGLNTAFEDLEKLHGLQHTLAVHPLSAKSEKLGYISLENFHNYYNLNSQGISLESLHIATEKEEGGFFKALGSIISGIWKAIKALFKNIWNFFKRIFGFKTDQKAKAKKLKESKKQIDEGLDRIVKQNKEEKKEAAAKAEEKPEPASKPASTSNSVKEDKISELLDEILTPFEIEVKKQETKEDILVTIQRELAKKSIFSSIEHPLAYLTTSTGEHINHAVIENAVKIGLNNFPIYGAVMERIHQGVNEFFDRKDFYNNLKQLFEKHDYIGASNHINDFNDEFYARIFTVIPQHERSEIFLRAYHNEGYQTKYNALPESEDIGDIQSPYKGTHHMPFKIKYSNKELNLGYYMYDMVRAEHYNHLLNTNVNMDTVYIPIEEITRLQDINIKLSDINEEQKSENQRKFHDIEKRVNGLIENMEEILTRPTKIIEEKLRDLEARSAQSARNGHSSMFPGLDNLGNNVYELQAELELYKRNKRFNAAALSLIRNNLQTLAVIFRNYSDYLVSIQTFLTHINLMFQLSMDMLKAKQDEILSKKGS